MPPSGRFRDDARQRDDGVSHLAAMVMGPAMIGAACVQFVARQKSKPMM